MKRSSNYEVNRVKMRVLPYLLHPPDLRRPCAEGTGH